MGFIKKVVWKNKMPKSVSMGALSAIWTIEHVIEMYPYGGIGGNTSVITLASKGDKWVAETMPEERIEMHRQNIVDGQKELTNYFNLESNN